jgi:hypothetical protein
MAKNKLLSGRVKVTPAANVAADRYNYLGLEQAEPNLGVASADGWVLTYSTASPGNRLWQSSSLLSGGLVAQSAFATANNAEALSTSAYAHANAAYVKANTVGLHANAAFAAANTKYSSSGGTITGDVVVTGNLSVEGTTVTVNVTTLAIEDSIIQLAKNNISDTIDIGFLGQYNNGSANVHTGLVRHADDDKYYLFENWNGEPTSQTIDISNPSFKIATLSANLTANSVLIRGLDPLTQANTADQRAVTSGVYANAAFGVANSASSYANGAFAAANTADQRAVTSGSYANSSYIHANAAFAYANTISGGSASDSIARAQANSSYIHANAAFNKANTGSKSTASATAPVSPSVGDMWYDTDTDVLLRYTNDGTSNNWIDITGPIIGRSTYIRPTYLITANAS